MSAPALLLHSLGLDGAAYAGLRAALPAGQPLVAGDQCGHGARAAARDFTLDDLVDDALAALDRFDGPVHMVGHSMGGAVAALAAARAPGRVASLALIATPPAGGAVFAQRADDAAALDGGDTGVEPTIAPTLERWFDGDSARHAAAIATAQRALRQMAPAGLAAAWRALASFPGYAAIGRLPPTLCIAGSEDRSTPPAAMQRIVDTLQREQPATEVRFETVAGAGHMAPLTRPHDVASLLLAHWQRHSTERRPA